MPLLAEDTMYSERMDDALTFAAATFRNITRKDGATAYLWHLLAVASMVGEAGGDEDQVIAGILHDYLEDIDGGSSAILATRFGPKVVDYVEALSDCTTRPKPPWRERKEGHIARMREASDEIKLIALCDKIDNARATLRDYRAIGDAVWERFNAPKAETLWYYRAVYAAIATTLKHPMLAELDELVKALHQATGTSF
ncbi:MAG: bifunctional (p)ppGpp synthetase/guanosine-3',5'-bis(diphosphate) 3'-pyrophosphohydrolase [Deltaproteobacteria bacterium]|nr:bifunctional (p)ppGpp synthetase/guanosine-3',5'-bis(diphosphate) 3'-pyrophosphohydrolase [Deltaproteobacteria bacterium]